MQVRLDQVFTLAGLTALAMTVIAADHFPPWTSFHSEAPAFLAALLLLAACLTAKELRIGAPIFLLLGLIALAWIQHATGVLPHAGDAWVVSAYLLTLAAAWLWGAHAVRVRQQPGPLALVCCMLVLTGLLVAFQAFAQWLQVESHWPGWVYAAAKMNRSIGNFGQPNLTATWLLMSIASLSVFMTKRQVGRLAAWPILLMLTWAVVLTQSRTALLSATLMVGYLLLVVRGDPDGRNYRADAVVWLLLLFGGSWLLQSVDWAWGRRALGAEAMVAVGSRPILWKQLLVALAERPWSGYGWLQIAAAQQIGAAVVPGTEQANHAHNLFLDALVMLGVPLTVTILAGALAWFLRRLRRQPSWDAMAALGVLVPLLVHSQLEFPYAFAYFLVPFGILLGVFDASTRKSVNAWVTVRGVATAPVIALSGALLLALGSEYLSAEEAFRVNRFENLRLGQTPPAYAPPDLVLLTQVSDMLDAMRLRASPDMSTDDLETLARAARRYTWAPLHFRAALASGLNGRTLEAADNLRIIRDLFPPVIVEEGRQNWISLQQRHSELAAIPFPPVN